MPRGWSLRRSIGLLINLIFGGWFTKRRWGEAAVGTVASLASGAAFVVSVLLAYSVSPITAK